MILLFAILFVALGAARSQTIQTQLRCGSNPVIPIEGKMRLMFLDQALSYYYRNSHRNLNCRWKFSPIRPQDHLSIRFIDVGLDPECQSVLLLRTFDRRVKVCNLDDAKTVQGKLYKSFEIDLDSATSKRYEIKIKLDILNVQTYASGCDFPNFSPGTSSTLLFRLNKLWPTMLQSLEIGVNKPISKLNFTTEIIRSPGDGLTACFMGEVLVPKEETPSCHSSVPSTCQWYRVVGISWVDELDKEGKEFKLIGNHGEMRTNSTELQLEFVCLYIEYTSLSETGQQARILLAVIPEGTSSTYPLKEANLTADGRWATKKIIARVPDSMKGKKFQLQLKFNDVTDFYINKIFGCNPYVDEDRTLIYNVVKNPPIVNLNPAEGKNLGHCKNGGYLQQKICICPPGFTGQFCERACGRNRWGPECKNLCSQDSMGCKFHIFCNTELSCVCGSGLKGSLCGEECEEGKTFGAQCLETCGKCRNQLPCDPVTGQCLYGCQPGYVPPYCDIAYAHFVNPPEVAEVGYTFATLSHQLNGTTRGERTPVAYQVLYKREGWKDWMKDRSFMIPEDKVIRYTIRGLEAGRNYSAKILLRDDNMDFYDSEDLASVDFVTHCQVINDLWIHRPIHVDRQNVKIEWEDRSKDIRTCVLRTTEIAITSGLRWESVKTENNFYVFAWLISSKKYKVRVRAIAGQGASEWSKPVTFLSPFKGNGRVLNLRAEKIGKRDTLLKWDSTNADVDNYMIDYICIEMLGDMKAKCDSDVGILSSNKTNFLLSGLEPGRKYSIKVQELPGVEFSEIIVTTKPDKPEVNIEKSNVTVTNSSASLTWHKVGTCDHCNGLFIGYRYVLRQTDGEELQSGTVSHSKVELMGLMPQTTYKFSVYYLNSFGWSVEHRLDFEFTTKASVPSVVRNLTVYKQGRTQLGLKWMAPATIFGDLASFTISLTNYSAIIPPSPCPAWPNMFCHTIEQLLPDTLYNISVSARNSKRNEDGPSVFVAANTTESAPGKPVNLTVVNVTETSAALEWAPPDQSFGVLRCFLVKIEQTKAFLEGTCCQNYPKMEVDVLNELPKYGVEIKGLQPASTYAVSVMGETVWLGPAVRVSLTTRPPSKIGPLPRPNIVINATYWNLVWPEPSGDSNFTALIENVLVIVCEENSTDHNSIQTVERRLEAPAIQDDLKNLVLSAIGQSGYIAVVASLADPVVVGTGAETVGRWGVIHNPPLALGYTYRLKLVYILNYNNVYNIANITSLPFAIH